MLFVYQRVLRPSHPNGEMVDGAPQRRYVPEYHTTFNSPLHTFLHALFVEIECFRAFCWNPAKRLRNTRYNFVINEHRTTRDCFKRTGKHSCEEEMLLTRCNLHT